jgi:transcriptional regulator with XRE-family HTH domain
MRQRWDRSRVIAILKSLRDEHGFSVAQMAKMAGVGPGTVYRWMGEGGIDPPQPTRIPIQNLAWAIERRHPELARQLVKAAGHPWEDRPEGEQEPLVSEELAESFRRSVPEDAEWIIAERERRRAARLAGQPEAPEHREQREGQAAS